ncbi:MAG: ABC transporter ATP-binding protein [Limnochordaceae bacterium]|nr:ABC transporter ATP-binding protein [Limnochordaceae bacterium]
MFVGLLIVLGYGGLLAGREGITVGTITAFVVVYERLSWPIQTLLRTWPNLQQSLAAAERTYELIDEPLAPGVASNHPQGSSRADLLPIFRIERIEFDHVCFSYPGTPHPVLNDLTFTIDGGKFTAIVGPTGAGKSTIIRLLLRLFDPDSGVIRVFFSSPTPSSDTRGLDILGGTPIQSQSCMELRSIPVSTWRSLIGYVPQEPGLFDVSLEENIRMGRRGLPSPMAVQMGVGTDQVLSDDSEQLEAAVRLALLGDVVKRLPDGLATCIGERGSHLSGGERQRVAIARAAYRNPSLLLLDEATSSLDNVNERLVQRALLGLSAGRTTVAIAHRLSTVMGADRILVVDEGRVIEQGSHEQLLAAGGKYASLFAAGQLLGNGSHGMATREGA